MNPPLTEIIAAIHAASPPSGMRTKIIGIDGCGGAGKSTFARQLGTQIDAQIIQTDDFASPDTPLHWDARLLAQVLTPLGANQPCRYQRYDWATDRLAEWRDVPVGGTIILEGVSSTRQTFRPMLCYKIYVDAPRDLRLERGLQRDGTDALPLWQAWQREEDAYVQRETPAQFADVILDGTAPLRTS